MKRDHLYKHQKLKIWNKCKQNCASELNCQSKPVLLTPSLSASKSKQK